MRGAFATPHAPRASRPRGVVGEALVTDLRGRGPGGPDVVARRRAARRAPGAEHRSGAAEPGAPDGAPLPAPFVERLVGKPGIPAPRRGALDASPVTARREAALRS